MILLPTPLGAAPWRGWPDDGDAVSPAAAVQLEVGLADPVAAGFAKVCIAALTPTLYASGHWLEPANAHAQPGPFRCLRAVSVRARTAASVNLMNWDSPPQQAPLKARRWIGRLRRADIA
jgi:hypothetical protein